MSRIEKILVEADWMGLPKPIRMGQLHRAIVRGEEILSFEYSPEWLRRTESFQLDPQLQFVSGRQYPDTSGQFGMFLDSAPDRWGRLLIQRRTALEAKGTIPQLYDSDYLLAVSDTCRLGGLRFKVEDEGPYLAEDRRISVPPLSALRELQQAAWNFESAERSDPEYSYWLNMLLAPGSSLGGARPKGTVMDPSGELWVAKFPSRSDTYDVGAWEAMVYQLAGEAGLFTTESRAETFSSSGPTFLIKRFDRNHHQRIHFASAMNLLGYHDGDGADTGASYLDLVDLIERAGANPTTDLEELWRRIVFNICIHNTDDHLRNHGFLMTDQGWRLSPVYDLNPQPWAGGLSLNIDESSNACDLDLARTVAPYFRLSEGRRETILKQVLAVVGEWEALASKSGIRRSEIDLMRQAFSNAR